ncbi:PIN domain-containing protein [Natronorubrum daqingense]|uniref:PIN domain-containing protein n=1 Tax=Natronorubrum daqingense TaxID=588898 RepID=A0A1N6Y697_9EURY|nr:PIN domain-containing protein [Natronorubrum daqingense]APX95763.1 hypothetical protein BB347_03550 [Natronorubrum daqingense]SIR10152.1 hypothetical protein/tRNA(fMet)-specific endonuclease VapC [Natronorubrum daqingense]
MKVLDSSFCADFLRGYDHAKQFRLEHENEVLALPAIGFYELYHGALKVGRDPETVDRDLPWVSRLEYTPEHGLAAARILTELEHNGNRLQHPDMMIAGVARSLGVPVVTCDDGFTDIDSLEVENPRQLYG